MLTTLVQVVVVGLINLIFSATLHSINQFVYFRQLGPQTYTLIKHNVCITPNITKLVDICLTSAVTGAAESLLVVASVGVQLTTTFASGRQTAVFYDIADISGIVINEAVTMVKHYATV